MTIGSIIVLGIIVAAIILAIVILVHDHKMGRSSCGCSDCSGCCDCCKTVDIKDR